MQLFHFNVVRPHPCKMRFADTRHTDRIVQSWPTLNLHSCWLHHTWSFDFKPSCRRYFLLRSGGYRRRELQYRKAAITKWVPIMFGPSTGERAFASVYMLQSAQSTCKTYMGTCTHRSHLQLPRVHYLRLLALCLCATNTTWLNPLQVYLTFHTASLKNGVHRQFLLGWDVLLSKMLELLSWTRLVSRAP